MKYTRRSLHLLLLLVASALFGAAPALAQQQEITGTVTDADDGLPIPGANIVVPGTTIGTATGADGSYALSVPETADSLTFSFVGYEPQTVAIAGRSVIDVALGISAAQLEDLVVIGYGEQEARDVTGVISTVTAEGFNAASSVGPEQLISGKIAGVQVSAPNGAPGAGNLIRIRGATSVNASSAPLFVIDGVPISNEGIQGSRNPLNFLNPDDVASVTVLKDASATAIYGSRGANGVILIQTKDGSTDGVQVAYTGEAQASTIQDGIDVLDAAQFREVVQRADAGEIFQDRDPTSLMSRLGDATTDWQDAVLRTGYGQEHTLSLSRGFEDASLRFSLGYLDQEGILQSSATQRTSLSLSYDQSLFDERLSISTSVRGSQTKDDFEAGVVGGAASFAPTQPIRDLDSPFGGFFEWDGSNLSENNPVAEYILTRNEGTTYRSLGSVDAEYEMPFLDGLSLRAVLGYDVTTGEREFFAPTFLKGQAESDNPGRIERATFTRLNTLFDAFANYDTRLDAVDSRFDVTVGYSYQDFYEEYPELAGGDLRFNFLGANSTAFIADDAYDASISVIPSRLISGFARVNYTFMDRYLITATVRRDGSSRFGPENRWGTFPSAALAWRAHQEEFVQEAAPWLSNLKLRASWGIVGNQEIPDFLYSPFYTPGDQNSQVQFGDEFITTFRPKAADPNIKWEETTTTNLGVDYGFFDDRFTGSFEFYNSTTEDLLFDRPAPAGANLSNFVLVNIGSMRNRGFEFSIEALVAEADDFSYTAQLNASTNDNELLSIDAAGAEVLSLPDPGSGISGAVGNTIQRLQEGEPLFSFYVYQHKRDANGDPIYIDVDGNGIINEQDLYEDVNGDSLINDADRVIAGNAQPDWILGHTSQVRYRDFDLSLTLRAHLGGQVYNNVASNYGYYERLTDFAPSNLHESVLDYGFVSPQYLSDVYVEDASFLRLDNVTLGYTLGALPGVSRVRVYGAVSNAFVLTGYSGTDPEIGDRGIDNNLYPRSRTFTGGVNVQF